MVGGIITWSDVAQVVAPPHTGEEEEEEVGVVDASPLRAVVVNDQNWKLYRRAYEELVQEMRAAYLFRINQRPPDT